MRLLFGLLILLICLPAIAEQRVISLAPSLTDLLLELGAGEQLVGVLDGETRPAELAGVASVGRHGQINLEQIVALQPDLLLVWLEGLSAIQLQALQSLNIPIYLANPQHLQEIPAQLRDLGKLLGKAEQGEALAKDFNERLQALRLSYRRERPLRVFYQIWERPLYTLGGRQIINEALQVCGARNLFADVDLPAPQVSEEGVLARNPEVILSSNETGLERWAEVQSLAATRLGQLWVIPDKRLERPSYAMLEATAALCQLLAKARND